MESKYFAAAALSAVLLASPAFAQQHGGPDQMQMRFQQMQGMADQMQHAPSPAERHKLMAGHMQVMQEQMADMQKTYGPGMMMQQGGAKTDLQPQMRMMQQRMDMMQQMMQQMMMQQQMMMKDTMP